MVGEEVPRISEAKVLWVVDDWGLRPRCFWTSQDVSAISDSPGMPGSTMMRFLDSWNFQSWVEHNSSRNVSVIHLKDIENVTLHNVTITFNYHTPSYCTGLHPHPLHSSNPTLQEKLSRTSDPMSRALSAAWTISGCRPPVRQTQATWRLTQVDPG